MSDELDGYVEKIVFRNHESGYTVLNLVRDDIEMTCVGIFPFISEGEFLHVSGSYISHPVYGEQLKVDHYEIKEPEDLFSMERYLSSGAIKGIGTALAGRIVKKFKKDTFRVIEEEPERLAEVKGISERIAREVAMQFEEKREMRGAMLFLQQYGITTNMAIKIYNQYKQDLYEVIKKNPYKLADDIHGIGFRLADEIAIKVGILANSDFRIKAGILHALSRAGSEGHVYLPIGELMKRTSLLLLLEPAQMEHHLMEMVIDKRIIIKEVGEEQVVYGAPFYYMELNCAKMLLDLNISYLVSEGELMESIFKIEKETNIQLDEMQEKAVAEAAKNGLFVLTGGPGTGKTTTINAMIRFFEAEGMNILLAAPTGRAAKRITETTGYEAQTIHRLLEISGTTKQENKTMRFVRNECNPLEADVIIIDEMSMVDISLMHSLLKAVTVGSRLILVGDVNQLPSVGPGKVLKDIITSKCFSVVKLTKIFRQAAESDIILNAHKINRGDRIKFDNKSKDFFLLQRDNPDVIISILIQLIKEKLPKYVHVTPYDIQVLTPMRKGELGVEHLNQVLQQYMNPPSDDKRERKFLQGIFREGDKVMQIKNNYQLEWEVKNSYGIVLEKGTGIFNGDSGIIRCINMFAETMTVEFDERKTVEYGFSGLDELELAYAVTIHKSQGTEYAAVVIPILTGPRMLFNRSLLYTAITRAKGCVTIVGSQKMVQNMIDNAMEQNRYSGLSQRIREINHLSL